MIRKNQTIQKKRSCFFCTHAIHEIDYKDVHLLKRFISSYGKIAPRKRSGSCAAHQRDVSQAIKRARIMALLPFVIQ